MSMECGVSGLSAGSTQYSTGRSSWKFRGAGKGTSPLASLQPAGIVCHLFVKLQNDKLRIFLLPMGLIERMETTMKDQYFNARWFL